MASNDVDYQFSDIPKTRDGTERLVNHRRPRRCNIHWKSKAVMLFVPVIFFGAIAMVVYYAVITDQEPFRRDYCPLDVNLPLGETVMMECYRKITSKDLITVSKTTAENTELMFTSRMKDGQHNTTFTGFGYRASLYLDDGWINLKIEFEELHCTDKGMYHLNVVDRFNRPIAIDVTVYDPMKRDNCARNTKLTLGDYGVVHCGYCPPYGVQKGFLERLPKNSAATKIWFFDMSDHDEETADLGDRTSVSIELVYGMVVFEISFSSVWCSDNERLRWTFHSGSKGDIEIGIDVTTSAPILRCPSKIDLEVEDYGSFECNICVNASQSSYEVYKSKNDVSYVIFNSTVAEAERIGNKTLGDEMFIVAELNAGVLRVEFEFVAYCVHDAMFSVVTAESNKSTTINVIDSPEDPYFDVLGGLLNNTDATLKCVAKTGCSPKQLIIHELGIRVNESIINQTNEAFVEDFQQFSKTWKVTATWDTYVTWSLHNTMITCEYTYTDQRAGDITLKAEYKAYVLEEKFCIGRTPKCNYIHPYNRNLFLACLGIARPTVMICPASLRFIPDDCFGKCGPF